MEGATLLRSSLACSNRLFFSFRSSRRLSRFSLPSCRSCSSSSSSSSASAARNHRHCPIPSPTRRSLLRRHSRLLPSSSSSPHFAKQRFSSLSPRAIATPPTHSPPEFSGMQDEVVDKLGFEKVSEEFIGECKSKAFLLRHKKTGAQVISVSNDDENKVFGIVFRTPPNDSTGIPHILEHSVLCGSRKYPLKEPFVELLKGSLNTFLNAFTYPHRTCNPVASKNTKVKRVAKWKGKYNFGYVI